MTTFNNENKPADKDTVKMPSDIVPCLDVGASCIPKQLLGKYLQNLIAINSGIKPGS